MTPVISPPPTYRPPTASSAIVVPAPAFAVVARRDDLVEEPMNYSPMALGSVAIPEFPEEVWVDDSSGPTGF